MSAALAAALLAGAPAKATRHCPVGSHLEVLVTPPSCPPCRYDSPPEACRCTEPRSETRCSLGEERAATKDGALKGGVPSAPALPPGVPTLADAPLKRRKLTRLATGASIDFGFTAKGIPYHSKAPGPPQQPAPPPALPDGVTPKPGPFVHFSPDRTHAAYVAESGLMVLYDASTGKTSAAGPEGGDSVLSFFDVSNAGVAWLVRRGGYDELHWTPFTSGKDEVLLRLENAAAIVPLVRPGRPRIVLHVGFTGMQTVAEVDVAKKRTTVAIPAMPSWGNSRLSPDGRRLLFGVTTKDVQPREADVYLLQLGD